MQSPSERICRYCLEPLVQREGEKNNHYEKRVYCCKSCAGLASGERRPKTKGNRALLTGAQL